MTANNKPKAARRSNDKERMIETVRNLLGQAEDAGVTDEEAQAFAAKAAELMERHRLDEATVREEKGQKAERITLLEFSVSGQGWHGKGRAALVAHVAKALGCQVCFIGNKMSGKDRVVAIVGTATTLKSLELLLPSLLVQAEGRGTARAKEHMAKVRDAFDTNAQRGIERRTFFRSYLAGYGAGAADKIATTRQEMAEEVKGKPGELILASEAERIKAEFDKRFPKLKTARGDRSFNVAGAIAGVEDGRVADTGQTKVNKPTRKSVAAKK